MYTVFYYTAHCPQSALHDADLLGQTLSVRLLDEEMVSTVQNEYNVFFIRQVRIASLTTDLQMIFNINFMIRNVYTFFDNKQSLAETKFEAVPDVMLKFRTHFTSSKTTVAP